MAPARMGQPSKRLGFIFAALMILVAGLGVRLVQLQVLSAPRFEQMGLNKRLVRATLPAARGAIYDRDLEPIAVSAEARTIFADPAAIENPAEVAAELSPILGIPPGKLLPSLTGEGRFTYLARSAPPSVARQVSELELSSMIGQYPSIRRVYPSGRVAAQIVGFVGVDQEGLSGLESAYDTMLAGKDGLREMERDRYGRPIPGARLISQLPQDGKDLVLTIDRDLQWFAERALIEALGKTSARSGIAIVMDPKTGDVLAMANAPLFDPKNYAKVGADRRRNRAVTDAYEPGSVNKVITAALAIDQGKAWPGEQLRIPSSMRIGRYTFRDLMPDADGRMTYAEALARSSNLATIKVANRLGKARFNAGLRAFGLGEPTGIGFPGESSGVLPPPSDWSSTSMATIPIGQGIAATPIQIASVYATIANDGIRVRPRLVRGVISAEGDLIENPIAPAQRAVSPLAAAQVRQMLVGVVQEGTGVRAQIPGYLVAGKTGTARKPLLDRRGYSNEIVTTFAGFAPADDPRFVVTVSLDNPWPRYAATTAGPVFQEIMTFALGNSRVAASVSRQTPPAPARAQALPNKVVSVDPSPRAATSPPAPVTAVPQPSTVPTAPRARPPEPAA
ncbi:MAG: penicillin-binding transpeptidase domain-containing protein [Actinomycetota bacterium]